MTDETAAGAVPADTPRRIAGEDREPPPVADEAPAAAEGIPAYEPDHEASAGCCGPPVAVITLDSPAPSAAVCEACGGSGLVDSGCGERTPCPRCLSLVPRLADPDPAPPVRARHAAAPEPGPADDGTRKCAECHEPESAAVPMFDAGYAVYCASAGDCKRRQDAAKAARTVAA